MKMQQICKTTDEQWQSYLYEEPLRRFNMSLNLFWLREGSHLESTHVPALETIAREIATDLETTLKQFATAGDSKIVNE